MAHNPSLSFLNPPVPAKPLHLESFSSLETALVKSGSGSQPPIPLGAKTKFLALFLKLFLSQPSCLISVQPVLASTSSVLPKSPAVDQGCLSCPSFHHESHIFISAQISVQNFRLTCQTICRTSPQGWFRVTYADTGSSLSNVFPHRPRPGLTANLP